MLIPSSLKKRNTIDLFWILFRTDFKLRYNDSILGFLWVLIKPFSIFLILYFVLTEVFPSNIENFAIYLLIGNVFISFWNEGTNLGMDSLLSRSGLITKVLFPRYIVMLSSTALAVVNFIISTLITFIFLYFNKIYPTLLQIAWYFFCAFVLYFIIITLSMFLSVVYVKFRDLKQIWELFNQLLFWLTPVIYSYQVFIEKNHILEYILLWLNPVSVTLISARTAILNLDINFQLNVFLLFIFNLFVFIIGYLYYKKAIKKIAEFF